MNPQNDSSRGERLRLLIVGRSLLTIGVASVTVGAAIGAVQLDSLSALMRTVIGLLVAVSMVGIGDVVSRRNNQNFGYWLSTNLMTAGYALAYFFLYSLYYVPGLNMLSEPYASWVLCPMLAGIATLHASRNANLRWIAPLFTLLATGHASYHVLTSVAVVTVFGLSIKVAALGCFAGMIWCASLSSAYKRFEQRVTGTDDTATIDRILNKVGHELYFILAALNAMALPLFLSDLSQAPLWWSVEAPILLALSWRGANYFKHGVVGVMWAAAVGILVHNALRFGVTLPVLVSVPLSGALIGMAYRFLKGNLDKGLRVHGYALYVYGAALVALLVPYVQVGNMWDAMPYWMIEGLVICGAGIALRDKFVHEVGKYASAGALVLFALQYNTWTWTLVGPVIACAYGLSIAYNIIRRKDGWKSDAFLNDLPFNAEYVVTKEQASFLEQVWSWVGTGVALSAVFFLRPHDEAVIWWSIAGAALVAIGSALHTERFRYQGLVAVALAFGKLWGWELTAGAAGLTGVAAFTLYRAVEFVVFGSSAILASYFCNREQLRIEAQLAGGNGGSGNGGNGTPPANGGDNTDGNNLQ